MHENTSLQSAVVARYSGSSCEPVVYRFASHSQNLNSTNLREMSLLLQHTQLPLYRPGPSCQIRWSRCSLNVSAAVRKQASDTSDPSPAKKSSTPAPPTPAQTSAVRFVPKTRRRTTRPSAPSQARPTPAEAKNLEFQLQEQDADLTLEDLQEFDSATGTAAAVTSAAPYVARKKRAKADKLLASEYEFLNSQQQASSQEEEEYLENKKALLVALMTAGSDLPKKIEEISEEIDDTMLNLLALRINTAYEYGQDEAEVQPLLQLYSLLKTHFQVSLQHMFVIITYLGEWCLIFCT